MVDLEKLNKFEFTWEEYEREIVPHFLNSPTKYLLYREGKLWRASDYFREAFAFPGTESDQIDAALWQDPHERRRFQECVRRVLAGEKIEIDFFSVFNGKGDNLPIRIQFARVLIKDGAPVCNCLVFRGGELSVAEKIFGIEDQELFRIVVEQSLNGITLIDDRLQLLYANPAALAIYGYDSLEEARQVPLINTLAPGSLKAAVERLQNWLEGRSNPPRTNYRIVRKDGEVRDLEAITATVEVGGKRCHLNSIIDVTERVRAEKALRDSELRYRSLVETSPDAIILIDLEGTAQMVNMQTVEMMRASAPNDLIGRKVFDFIAPEDWDRARADIERTRAQKITRNVEYFINRLDGAFFPAEINASLVPDSAGKEADLILIIRDLTRRKQAENSRLELEARLRQVQKMEALGLLAGGMAHDLNNLLTVILTNSESIQLELGDQHPCRELTGQITTAVKRSGDLIRKLLAFARKGQLQKVPVNLHQIIPEVVQILERTIDKRIGIKQNLHARSAMILGDPSQLQSAILNLALNARDAMPQGGELVFTTATVSLDEDYCRNLPEKLKPGDYVQISVTDTGVGMDEETQLHAFEPFFTTKEKGQGSGLGLAGVYGCVKAHQGAIELKSQPGRGTDFTILLPMTLEKEREERAGADLKRAQGERLILVVDDEEMILKSVARILGELGHRIVSFTNGLEAIEYYGDHAHQIDLVILDMVMPRPNGKEVFLEMKKINPQLKAFLFSGYSLNGDAREMLKQGLKGILPKPFTRDQLFRAIEEALGQ